MKWDGPFRIRGELSPIWDAILGVGAFLILLLCWWFVSALHLVDSIFLPDPVAVARAWKDSLSNPVFWSDMEISVVRILGGFLLAVIVGFPIGILCGIFRPIYSIVMPIIEFIRYMPVPAFIPLIMIWIGIDEGAKISVIFLGTVVQLLMMVSDDVRSISSDLLNVSYTLGAKRRHVVFRVLIPAIGPSLLNTLRLTLGWAWTYLVVAELVAASNGIGFSILRAQRFLQTDTIFVGVMMIGLIGLISDRLLGLARHLCFPWAEKGGQ